MSRWTHIFCGRCWAELNPGRQAAQMKDASVETCCRCGRPTGEGIFVRHDPQTLPCGGQHPEDDAGVQVTCTRPKTALDKEQFMGYSLGTGGRTWRI